VIELEGLTRVYQSGRGAVRAVDGLSLTVGNSEVFGLLGPNGAGKTTAIKMMTTLSRPDAGRCLVGGFDVVREPGKIRERIGVVPQENNLERELTARENLTIYAMLHRVRDAERRIEENLRRVDLWDRRDSVVAGFSGGMQRRLLLARALLAEPSVLFLDEPSIGLDPQIRRQLWDSIRKTRIDGRTVVITTHYIEEAEALCDRVGILCRGKLVALDSPENLKRSVGECVVEFIDAEGKLVQHIHRGRGEANADAAGEHNGSVTVRKTNLEDVFIKLTGERIE
jgi:ABC-2 type transport system ATP-binding protein